jgi:DNA-binding response OmpR family regulator
MPNASSIFLIEDSAGECELFRQALVQARLDVTLYTEHDAEAALHFLRNQRTVPALILLDWHLRSGNGSAFLKELRSGSRFTTIPVVIFTTSDDAADFSAACANGANGYVVKPATFEELVRFVTDLYRYWLTWDRTASMVGTGA